MDQETERRAPVDRSGNRQARAPLNHAQRLLEGFSLTPLEAGTLLAILRLGTATANQLVPITGTGRTNVYRLLESLEERQLVTKIPGRTAVWVAADREEIIWRLRQREQERLQSAEEALGQLRSALADVPQAQEKAAAVFQVTDEVTLAFRYPEAVASAAEELLVFNRGPYVAEIEVDDAIVATVVRGVRTRALWQSSDLYGPGAEAVYACAIAYASAGVDSRVVAELPLSMAVIDGRVTLLAVPGDEPADTPYVANAVIHNRTFGGVMGEVFDQYWERGKPLDPASPPPLPARAKTSRSGSRRRTGARRSHTLDSTRSTA